LFRLQCSLPNAFNLGEEVRKLSLSGFDTLYAFLIGRDLSGDNLGNICVEVMLVGI